MINLDLCTEFSDFRKLAKKKLPNILFEYIDGGSYQQVTLSKNTQDFQKIELQQRIMMDVANVDSSTEILGHQISMPVVLGPVGFSGMYSRRGEVQASKAAQSFNLPFCLSTLSICSIAEVASDAGQPPWFQLYMIKDRDWVVHMIEQAKSAGCKVLLLTADLQTPGARYRDIRSGMSRKLSMLEQIKRGLEGIYKMGWTWDVYFNGRPHGFGNLTGKLSPNASFDEAWAWIASNFDPSITWKDLEFIRAHWDGPIILKGVMTTEDAKLAVEHKLDGIIISNHGGRQLDSAPSTISVLPDIAEAVEDKTTVMLDGGIRSGLDVLKAIKLGAKACFIGRAWAFPLAAGGQEGVEKMLSVLQSELRAAQVLSGTISIR